MGGKLPGRVGDSPILGAGLYVDNEVGAAGSTGRGEANLFHLASFLVVEEMRRGAAPKDAGLVALRRVAERIRNGVEEAHLAAGSDTTIHLTVSVGATQARSSTTGSGRALRWSPRISSRSVHAK